MWHSRLMFWCERCQVTEIRSRIRVPDDEQYYEAVIETISSEGSAEVGIAVDRALVRHGDFRHEGGFRCGGKLLDLDSRPTAIFSGNDQQALGVYEAARQRGLRIPQDLSVVGFDDLPVARWVSPPLTTVRQPLAEMGRAAAQMLGELIENRPLDTRRMELSTELITRESTGPAR
jgi:LacI family transcriptional regulator